MANLRKPDKCLCGSNSMGYAHKPERWVCMSCGDIIIEKITRIGPDWCKSCLSHRHNKQFMDDFNICVECAENAKTLKEKPKWFVCKICGAERWTKPFKKGQYICIECSKLRRKEYNKNNNERLLLYRKQKYVKARALKNRQVRVQSCPEQFLNYKTKDSIKRAKSRPEKFGPSNIDTEYVIGIYKKQNGLCALTGIKMTHRFEDLKSMSIDRINPSKGYVKGNVQITCKWANIGKRDKSNEEFRKVLNDCYEAKKRE